MKIAGHTMGTPEYTLEEAINLFEILGFDGIEIIWDDQYGCALPKKASPGTIKKLKSMMESRNIAVSCLTPYMSEINSLDGESRNKSLADFMSCIEVAGEMQSRCIRVYGGSYFEEKERTVRVEKEKILIESLEKMAEKAEGFNVVLVVETHFNTLTCTARETEKIIQRVNHPHVKVLYDQANLGFVGAEGYKDALKLLHGIIGMVHVKDFVFRKRGQKKFRASRVFTVEESERNVISKIPGEGSIPWPRIIASLTHQNFDGYLSIEYERRWYPDDLPPAYEGMKRGLEYIHSLIP